MDQTKGYQHWKQSYRLDMMQWLAIIAMTVDHASKAWGNFENPFFVLLGRMALPLFALMLAMHVVHSTNFKGLFLRLTALAVLSQPGFYLFWGNPDYAMYGLLQHWNVIATLMLGALAVKLLVLRKYLYIPIVIAIAFALNIDFSGYGVLVMLVAGFTQTNLLNDERREFIAMPATTVIAVIPFLLSYHTYGLGLILSGVIGIAIACAIFWHSWFMAMDSLMPSSNPRKPFRMPALMWRGFYPIHFWIIFAVVYLLDGLG